VRQTIAKPSTAFQTSHLFTGSPAHAAKITDQIRRKTKPFVALCPREKLSETASATKPLSGPLSLNG